MSRHRLHLSASDFRGAVHEGRLRDARRAELVGCLLVGCQECWDGIQRVASSWSAHGFSLSEGPGGERLDLVGRALLRLIMLETALDERVLLMPAHLEAVDQVRRNQAGFAVMVGEEAVSVVEDLPEHGVTAAIQLIDFARRNGRGGATWDRLDRLGHALLAQALHERGDRRRGLSMCPIPREAVAGLPEALLEARVHRVQAILARERDPEEALWHLRTGQALLVTAGAPVVFGSELELDVAELVMASDPARAIPGLKRAVETVPERLHLRLRTRLIHQLATALTLAGDRHRARELLDRNQITSSFRSMLNLKAMRAFLLAVIEAWDGSEGTAWRFLDEALDASRDARTMPVAHVQLLMVKIMTRWQRGGRHNLRAIEKALEELVEWPEAFVTFLTWIIGNSQPDPAGNGPEDIEIQ